MANEVCNENSSAARPPASDKGKHKSKRNKGRNRRKRSPEKGRIAQLVRDGSHGFIKPENRIRGCGKRIFVRASEFPKEGLQINDVVMFQVVDDPRSPGKRMATQLKVVVSTAQQPNARHQIESTRPVADWQTLANGHCDSPVGWDNFPDEVNQHYERPSHTHTSLSSFDSQDDTASFSSEDSVVDLADGISFSLDFLDDDNSELAGTIPPASSVLSSAANIYSPQWHIGQRVRVRDEHEDSDWKMATVTRACPCVEACPDGWDESYEWEYMQVQQ